ncbi:MAG: PQQ-dependent sugar dehydrogenase [Deltaproteobacteria bacterium]|nr:PQQ-dependent sugar dehydrogenase [Deltaproteobacteria bacterium]
MRHALLVALSLLACGKPRGSTGLAGELAGTSASCELKKDLGADGATKLQVTTLASGLEVPWSIAFLPSGDALVAERPGRIRWLRKSQASASVELVPAPVATIAVHRESEGGLLGLAVDPQFASNRRIYVYFTAKRGDGTENRVERWIVSEDGATAKLDRPLLEGIAAAKYHDGGRLRFGPDGMLWIATGDAREPDLSQKPESPSGKLLRVTVDGAPAPGNPWPGNRAALMGIRNLQAFDFLDAQTIVLADHGPSGELGRRGHDEISVARLGANLGWPTIWGCQARAGMIAPLVVFEDAVPPGGGVLYRADRIPGWKGSFVVAALEAKSLHRFALDAAGARVLSHEVYLRKAHGRLREVVVAPDGALWVSTSNCDSRGDCGDEKDRILRLSP